MPYQAPIHRHAGWKPPEQSKVEFDQQRGTTAQRGYDKNWQRLSIEFRAANPFCQCDVHKGKDERALSQVVDHIKPISTHPELRLEWTNLRSMTKACHDSHTARTQGFARGKA